METRGKVSLDEAVVACMMANNCDNSEDGMSLFTKAQVDISKVVAHYSLVICSRDREVEACAFRQLAKCALEMSVMVERGFSINQIMKKVITESNEVNVKLAKNSVEEGERVSLTTLGVSSLGDTEVLTTSTDIDKVKEKIYDA